MSDRVAGIVETELWPASVPYYPESTKIVPASVTNEATSD
jgi:hypothetical protein